VRQRGHARAARCRPRGHGGWRVRARIERFGEPALLLLLRERPAHGYELVEGLEDLLPGERVDMGNLYRVLRALEEDGLVTSEWHDELPGPAKRVYRLTPGGARLLDDWAAALERARGRIDGFLTRYTEERG
jgi:PadR family transcriptional regulator, regulatory protein PadR